MDRKEYRQRLAQRPRSVRFEELERLLIMYGWELDSSRGSHFTYRRAREKFMLPFRRGTVLPAYVHEVLKRTAEDDDDDSR